MKRYADMMRIGFNTEIEVSSDKVLWSSFFTQVYFSQQLFRRGDRKVMEKKNPILLYGINSNWIINCNGVITFSLHISLISLRVL